MKLLVYHLGAVVVLWGADVSLRRGSEPQAPAGVPGKCPRCSSRPSDRASPALGTRPARSPGCALGKAPSTGSVGAKDWIGLCIQIWGIILQPRIFLFQYLASLSVLNVDV